MRVEEVKRSLIWHGMLLFLLGLLTGLAEPQFKNMRMGLAAHLEGVMNGTFVIALGAVWHELRLSSRWNAAAYWAALWGTYGNWVCTTLAAIFGTAALSPITGAHGAEPWQEAVVTVGFFSVAIAIVGCLIMMLAGMRRSALPAPLSAE
jgi:hydroxylaminobenzene mutase